VGEDGPRTEAEGRGRGLTEVPPRGPAHEAFFGRRKGKPLRAGERRLLDEALPRRALDVGALPADLAALFATPVREVRLEIGFGSGEHLIAAALREPYVGFLGAEPFVNGVAKCLAKLETQAIANVRLWPDDARLLLDRLPDSSLATVHLLYPDPWPKRRHWKRRFVVDDNLKRLARALRPGGEFRFATDWANYTAWALAHVRRSSDFRWKARGPEDWREPWPDWTPTRYESWAVGEGRRPSYLTFVRV
jgi:tRNA (guanine-N7-)-methyltransferase